MLHRLSRKQPVMYEGAIKAHDYTSYFSLTVVMLVVGFLVTFYTSFAQSPGPQSGSIGLSGVMPGPAPDEAPVITSPINGQRFSQTPITVKGTCQNATLVEIFKNDIFAGSTFCEDNLFSIDIDLMYGNNILIARGYDELSQSSPASAPVTVFYDVLGAQAAGRIGLDFGGAQLLLVTDAVYRGNFPDKEMAISLTIMGGRPPYAVNIQWGDSQHSLVPRNNNAVFQVPHTYKKPGTYPISIQATDADGRVAFLTVAAVVNGQPDPVHTAASASAEASNMWLEIWPLYVAIFGIIISFFLGERHEKRVLAKHHQLISQV